jgi:hypothetical protein
MDKIIECATIQERDIIFRNERRAERERLLENEHCSENFKFYKNKKNKNDDESFSNPLKFFKNLTNLDFELGWEKINKDPQDYFYDFEDTDSKKKKKEIITSCVENWKDIAYYKLSEYFIKLNCDPTIIYDLDLYDWSMDIVEESLPKLISASYLLLKPTTNLEEINNDETSLWDRTWLKKIKNEKVNKNDLKTYQELQTSFKQSYRIINETLIKLESTLEKIKNEKFEKEVTGKKELMSLLEQVIKFGEQNIEKTAKYYNRLSKLLKYTDVKEKKLLNDDNDDNDEDSKFLHLMSPTRGYYLKVKRYSSKENEKNSGWN